MNKLLTLKRFREVFIEQQFSVEDCNPGGFFCLILSYNLEKFNEEETIYLKEKINKEMENDFVIMPPNKLLIATMFQPLFCGVHAAYRLGVLDRWIREEANNGKV